MPRSLRCSWLLAIAGVRSSSSRRGVEWTPNPRPSRRCSSIDGFASFFKILFLVIVAIVSAALGSDFLRETRYSAWEYYSLMAFASAA